MATIKSYTDLEQSKKLAEILPIESADMHYVLIDSDKDLYSAGLDKYIGILPHYPAWSLASLLYILPILDDRSPITSKTYDKKYRVLYHSTACERGIFTHDYDNPIDACVAMIEKLNELNLL